MASPLNFRNSPGTPSVLTDMFLPVLANLFLITLMLIIKFAPELTNFISGMLRSQKKYLQSSVYSVVSMITVLATLCDHSALTGVTMWEVFSMPNGRTWLTPMSFVDYIFLMRKRTIGIDMSVRSSVSLCVRMKQLFCHWTSIHAIKHFAKIRRENSSFIKFWHK